MCLCIVACAKEKETCKLLETDYGMEFLRCHPTAQNGDYDSDECKECCDGLKCCYERSQTGSFNGKLKVYVCKKRC